MLKSRIWKRVALGQFRSTCIFQEFRIQHPLRDCYQCDVIGLEKDFQEEECAGVGFRLSPPPCNSSI